MTNPRWGFDEGTLHISPLKRTGPHPPDSLAVPEKAHDRGRRVSFCDVGGLLRDEESPGGGWRSKESESASGSASGSRSGSYDSMEAKVASEEVMLNDVGGLLGTVVEGDKEG